MKSSLLRAEVTVDAETKVIAIIISMLKAYGYGSQLEILRTAANRFGFDVIRK